MLLEDQMNEYKQKALGQCQSKSRPCGFTILMLEITNYKKTKNIKHV